VKSTEREVNSPATSLVSDAVILSDTNDATRSNFILRLRLELANPSPLGKASTVSDVAL